MQDEAIRYAKAGIPIFPLAPRSKLPLIPKSRGGNGLYDATTDVDQVLEWWINNPDANIGARTGIKFDVVDMDGPDAVAAIHAEQSGRERLAGPVVQTARGWHVLVEPTGLGNRAGVLPGVDYRGSGGYVVAPPSVHESGHVYRWVRSAPLGPAPSWLVELLAPERPAVRPAEPLKGPKAAYGRAALRRATERLGRAVEGTRNHQLNRESFGIGQLVADGCLDEQTAVTALVDAGLALGLGHREVVRTVESGMSAGMAHPPTQSLDAG
jgi:Bifunctional DNA primase/polymerase, N-terminal